MTTQAQLYPLDKNRKLLSELVDKETGVIRKVFRVFAQDGDFVDIEYFHVLVEEHLPQQAILKPVRCKYTVANQQVDADGYLHKLMLMDEGGTIKDYYVMRKYPKDSVEEPKHDTVGNHIAPLTQEDRAKKRKIEIPGLIYTRSESFLRLLLDTKVGELQVGEPSGDKIKIFVAYMTDKAPEVFQGLVDHQYYSCPVVESDGKTYRGFIDLVDFVGFFLENLREEQHLISEGGALWELMTKQSGFRRKKIASFLKYPLSRRNAFWPLSQGYSLFTAMEILAREPNLHRIPVTNDRLELVNMVTQSFVVDFLHRNIQFMGALKDKPLSLIPGIFHQVESINSDQKVLDAFRKILDNNITGVAVVDKDGRLVGAVSSKDLKGIDADGRWFGRMLYPYHEYSMALAEAFPAHKRPDKPIYALPTDTLETVIRLIHEYKIHRVFVVDNKENEKPIGIVTLRDILLEIVE